MLCTGTTTPAVGQGRLRGLGILTRTEQLVIKKQLSPTVFYRRSTWLNLVAFESDAAHDELMEANHPTSCRRRNHVHAAYVNAALAIKQFDLRRAENLLVREGVPRKVIGRILLADQPCRRLNPSSWAQQFTK